jgi:hypothetical protein
LAGWQYLVLHSEAKFPDWWLSACKRLPKELHKGFDSFFILVIWSIWLERNGQLFCQESKQVQHLIVDIRDEAAQWVGAGFLGLCRAAVGMTACSFFFS